MGQFKTQKPILYSTQKKDRACRRFYGVVFSLILIFGLFGAFSVKTAEAENNFIDSISFFKGQDGFNYIRFHVKTTFSKETQYTPFVRLYYQDGQYCTGNCNFFLCPYVDTYTAGNTYDKILYTQDTYDGCLDEKRDTTIYNYQLKVDEINDIINQSSNSLETITTNDTITNSCGINSYSN